MGTNMPEAIVTPEETKYRDKYYPGISSVKKRDLFCSSCGNRISYDADNYSSHPFLGTLQCQPCSDQFKFLKSTVTKIKAWKKKCLMCGSDQCQTLFPCPVKNCPYSFCQNCIKRNAPNSLLLADTPKWKCYVCETNPLWEARGACATLLSASPRRRKRQKLVQADSSEDDDIEDIMKIQKANLKNTIKSRRTMKSSSMTSVRRTRTSSRSVSRSSDPQEAEEDSEDEIEILPVKKIAKKNKKKEKSQKLLQKRKISTDRSSSMGRSISPELSEHSSKTSNTQISSTTTTTTRTSSLSSELKKPPLEQKSSSSLLALRRENSDSSSGKEFTQTKLIRESYVPLQRLSIGEKDYTHSPDIKNHEDKTLTKQQTFSLKNHVSEFLKELKTTSKRMSDAADQLQRHYAMKDSMKSLDATKLIAECKNTMFSLRQNMDNNEKKLITKFGVWCDKTKIKNIFINLTSIDDSPRPIKYGSTSKNDAKVVVPQSSSDDDDDDDDNNDEEKTKDTNHDKREFSRISNGSLDVTPEVSGCESDEIFTQIKETKKTLSPINEDVNNKCGTGGNNIDPELPPSPVSAESIVSNNSLHRIDQKLSNNDNSNNNNNNNNNNDESSNDMFSDESDKENERVAVVAATDDHDKSHSSNTREELGRASPMSRTEEVNPGRKREEEMLQDTTAISTDKRTVENNKKNRRSWIEAADDSEKLTKRKCKNSVNMRTIDGTKTATVHSKNEKSTISHGNFSSSSEEENDMTSDGLDKIDVPEKGRKVPNETENDKKIDDSTSREENEKVNVSSSSVVADVRKKTDDNNDDSSLNELISASSGEEEKASAKNTFLTKNNSESEKTGNTKKTNKSIKKKEKKMEPAVSSLQQTLSDLEEKRARESLLRCDTTSEDDADNDNVGLAAAADSSAEKSKAEENAVPTLYKGDDDDADDSNKAQYNDKDILNDKPTKDDEENSKENDSSVEASNAKPDKSSAKKGEKIDSSVEGSRVKKSLLLSQSGSSSDEAEAGLSHPHVSSKKSTKIIDSSMVVDSCPEEIKKDSLKLGAGESLEQLEENLKKNLLASDSSSSDDDESEKKESQSSIETAEQPKEKEKKNTSSYFSDEEERAKNDLLNSDVSLTDDMTTTKTTIMDTSTSLFDSEKKAKETLLNSSFSDESKNVTPEKSKSKIHKQADTSARLSSDSANDNDINIKRKNVEKKILESDENSDDMFVSPRAKRRKLHLKYNKFYKSDKKLGLCCKVMVERLPNRILRRHAKALKKSKEYLEDRALKSLTSLRHLENARKKDCGNGSDSDDTSTTSRHKKKSSKKPEGDTLMDHLNVNGEKVDNDVVSSSGGGGGGGDDDDNTSQKAEKLYKSGNLLEEAEAMTKNNLLETSDEEKIQEILSDDGEEEEQQQQKQQSDKEKKKQSNKERKSIEEIDETDDCKRIEKCEWKRSKLLTIKLSSSDEEEQSQKFEKKAMKLSQKKSNDDDSNDEDGCDASDDGDGSKKKKKKRIRRRRLNSDSDIQLTDESQSQSGDNDDDDDVNDDKRKDKKGKKRVKKFDNSSDSSSSTARSRPKPKRRRVRTANTDSDSDIEEINNSQGSPNKSGRKNIRKVMKDKQVADDTKEAAKQEEERLKRMAERQKLYNELYEARLAGEEKVDKLILDFDEESKEELLSVDEGLVKRLKPHQAQGIKFMWDACYESIERAKSTKGSGCILAHCMGLGKSFQVVTLTHTLLSNYEKTNVKTVLVVCPLSTVLNWVNEFKIWLKELNNDGVDDDDEVEVYELTKFKKNFERKYQLDRWQRTGGVLIMGYEMYRNLSNPTKKLQKKLKESFFKSLVNPGPDLVVCDEGHLLKSEATAISKAMSKIQTLRRIVLTGTPLQNNLTEYHCMVQFVKPNLLGTRKEFLNRFVNPIQNGQFDDSTEYDVKLMKKRAHVLHKMLEGSVQRFDYSVLTPFLPPKQEYVIFVKLTDVQVKLYEYYIENFARKHRGAGGSLFADFQALQRIWTHPIAIKLNADKAAEKKMTAESDSEGSLKDFIDDDSSSSESSSSKSDNSVISTNSSSSKKKKNEADIKRGTRANPVIEIPDDDDEQQQQSALPPDTNFEWWKQFVEDEHFEDLRISSKLRILFEILKECEHIGDKLLVFSQSLYSLTLIERFLAMIDDETQNGNTSDFIDGHTGSWTLGSDYFRLDGQTSTENRSAWCNLFNKPSNTRARLFLISTRAGGLGINLTAANRVIIFDASWNPSHDVQSIFRIYRFGQKKPCYVYRLLAAGTMEEKIYNRQVTKLSLSCRVVDEQQIERHYTNSDLAELYTFDKPDEKTETIGCPKDRLLAEIFSKYKDIVRNFHEHDSLLENKAEEELDEEERKQAWLEYEQEKAGRPPVNPAAAAMNNHYQDQMMLQFNQQLLNSFAHNGTTMNNELLNLQRLYEKDFPNMTPEQQKMMATKALMDMYSYVENHAIMSNRTINNPPMASNQAQYPNPTNTLANQLAQQAYNRAHQGAKQMTAAQRQIQYAQQFGNFKTLPGATTMTSQNSSTRPPPPVTQPPRAIITHDPDIIEITPSTTTSSNNTAQSSSSSTAQGKPSKYQEE